MKAATLLIEGIVKGILFQSTPPVKAATAKGKVIACPVEFQSTPPVKAATRTFPRERYTRDYFNPRRP